MHLLPNSELQEHRAQWPLGSKTLISFRHLFQAELPFTEDRFNSQRAGCHSLSVVLTSPSQVSAALPSPQDTATACGRTWLHMDDDQLKSELLHPDSSSRTTAPQLRNLPAPFQPTDQRAAIPHSNDIGYNTHPYGIIGATWQ